MTRVCVRVTCASGQPLLAMKYGPDLHHPSHMKLDAAAAMVRGLRERMDICAFTEELQRLQTLLENPGQRAAKHGDGDGETENMHIQSESAHARTCVRVHPSLDVWLACCVMHADVCAWLVLVHMGGCVFLCVGWRVCGVRVLQSLQRTKGRRYRIHSRAHVCSPRFSARNIGHF